MDPADSTPEYNPENSLSERTKHVIYRIAQTNLCTHGLGFFIAATLSLVGFGAALFIIIYNFLHPELTSSAWAEVTIAFILGVWVTNRPKLLKRSRQTGTISPV